MACAYSQDLRDRVIEAAGNGTSARKAAARFEVGVSTAIKWLGRVRDSGERSARRPGRRPGSKLDPHRDGAVPNARRDWRRMAPPLTLPRFDAWLCRNLCSTAIPAIVLPVPEHLQDL